MDGAADRIETAGDQQPETGKRLGRADRWRAAGVIWGASLVAGWPLLLPTLYDTHDGHYAFYNAAEFARALADGQLPVRWLGDLFGGRGLPVFVYYHSLAFYLAALPQMLGLGAIASVRLVCLMSLPLSGWAFYRWIREYVPTDAAAAGAVAWLLAPIHIIEIHVKGDPPAELAYVFAPLLALAIRRVAQRAAGSVPLLALASAGLVLSHSLTAVLMLPVAAGLVLVERPRRGPAAGGLELVERSRRSLVAERLGLVERPAEAGGSVVGSCARFLARLAAGAGLGALLSAFQWLPSLAEKPFVYIDSRLGILFFDYREHFVAWWQWLSPLWGYHGSFAGTNDDMSFQIGPVHLVGLGAGAFLLRRMSAGRTRRLTVWALAVSTLSLFLTLEASRPVWDLVGPMRYIQFPWRLLAPLAFVSSALVAVAVAQLEGSRVRFFLVAAGAAAPVLALVFGLMEGNRFDQMLAAWGAAAGAVIWLVWRVAATRAGTRGDIAPVTKTAGATVRGANAPVTATWTALAVAALCAATAFPWTAVPLHSRLKGEPAVIRLTEADLAADRVRLGIRRTAARDDYLPRTVQDIPPRDPAQEYLSPPDAVEEPPLVVERGNLRLESFRRDSWRWNLRYDAQAPARVVLNLHGFPGWTATLAGPAAPLPIIPDRQGRIVLDLPAGRHDVELRFGRTPIRAAADLLSLAGFALLAVAAVVTRRRAAH